MVVLNILQRQRDRLLGKNEVAVDVKMPYEDEVDLKGGSGGACGHSACTTYYLILTVSLMLALIGTSGLYLYDEYKHAQTHQFHGWCDIPMERDEPYPMPMLNEEDRRELMFKNTAKALDAMETFHEDFEILLDEEQAKINVPDFRDGKHGRFLHDFSTNWTAIVDIDEKRCFILPLDRKTVLPPQSLWDMISKMMDGYYDVNISFIKQNMMVVFPPVRDLTDIGVHIQRECSTYPVYRLEKYTSPVIKRSAAIASKFIEFAGKDMQEFDILNFADVVKYEEEQRSNSA